MLYLHIHLSNICSLFFSPADYLTNKSNGLVKSCFVDSKCSYKEFHERVLKIDGSKAELPNGFALISAEGYELSCVEKAEEFYTKTTKKLDHSLGSFNTLKQNRHDFEEKPGLPLLLPSVSFNDKIINASCPGAQSQKRKSTVVRLSLRRKSQDSDETDGLRKYITDSL